MQDVNLLAMPAMAEELQVAVGYSDHTLGIEVPIAAVALGAVLIEKHFTLDRSLAGPDHRASLVPDELAAMVRAVRNIEKALGDGIKKTMNSERENKKIIRKSIVAADTILRGERFTTTNIKIMRPGGGISPMHWDMLLGRKAKKSYEPDEMIEQGEVEATGKFQSGGRK